MVCVHARVYMHGCVGMCEHVSKGAVRYACVPVCCAQYVVCTHGGRCEHCLACL